MFNPLLFSVVVDETVEKVKGKIKPLILGQWGMEGVKRVNRTTVRKRYGSNGRVRNKYTRKPVNSKQN